ncbi:hypothetical protein MRX96_056982 [Rhipicephalus microplus]
MELRRVSVATCGRMRNGSPLDVFTNDVVGRSAAGRRGCKAASRSHAAMQTRLTHSHRLLATQRGRRLTGERFKWPRSYTFYPVSCTEMLGNHRANLWRKIILHAVVSCSTELYFE